MTDMRKELLELLSEDTNNDLRKETLKTTLGFKSAWMLLAENLRDVDHSKSYLEWEYEKFFEYCQQELQLNRTMVKKLLAGLQWIEEQAPEYKPIPSNRLDSTNLTRPAPDPEMIAALSRGMTEAEEKRLPYQRFVEIKEAALSGESSLSQVKRELRDAVFDEIRDAEDDPVKHVKRALSEVEKALKKWGEDESEEDKTQKISAVRDGLYELVSELET